MKTKSRLIIFILLLTVILTVSCSQDFIVKAGNFLNNTGVSLLGSEVDTVESLEIIRELDEDSAPSDIVLLIQDAKTSPSLFKALEKELDNKIVLEDDSYYSDRANGLKTIGSIVRFVARIEDEFNELASITDILSNAVKEYASTSDLNGTLAKVPEIGEYITDEFAIILVNLDSSLEGGISELVKSSQTTVMEAVSPYLGVTKELSNTCDILADSMPSDADNLTNLGFVNSVVGYEFFNNLISCAFSVSEGDTEEIIDDINRLIIQYDSLAVINPGVKTDELEKLAGTLFDLFGVEL